jgi:hypothetical protein
VIAGLLSDHRAPDLRGLTHGRAFREAVRQNVQSFRQQVRASGVAPDTVALITARTVSSWGEDRPVEIAGIAEGAGLPVDDLLAFNACHGLVVPDECTVLMAVGAAGANGSTMFLKNSDKIGADSLVGEGFHRYKEINVVVDLRGASGRRIVGVAAAGNTGLKMGINDAAVAAGSNIARTVQLAERRVNVTQFRAIDRAQILRDGLEYDSPPEAARWALELMMDSPTSTPGNVEFAGPDVAFVVEGSYQHWAVEEIRDRVAARSNMFVLLNDLNDPGDRSSRTRYARALELLRPLEGRVRLKHLRAFSQDHENGPGLNSICRHSPDHRDETSLSAMVATLNRGDGAPQVQFALGKPCWAWNDPEGVVSITLDEPPEAIPEAFRTGEVWRRLYVEEPRTVEASR